MHQAQIFRPLDVCLAVSDMLRSTPTTLSVHVLEGRVGWSTYRVGGETCELAREYKATSSGARLSVTSS